MSVNSATPPKARSASAGKGDPPSSATVPADAPTLTPAERKLVERLTPIYTMLAGGLELYGIHTRDTGLIGVSEMVERTATEAVQQWVVLGRTNKLVGKWLPKIADSLTAGGLISLHLVMLIPLAANRGLLPPAFNPMPQYGPGQTHQKIQDLDNAAQFMADMANAVTDQ